MKYCDKKDSNFKVDLHMHAINHLDSGVYDGSAAIEDLLREILENDIKIFSITEHDAIYHVLEISKFAEANNICYIPGVEITSTLEGKRHILAYGIDDKNERLNRLLAQNTALVDSGIPIRNLTFPSPEEVVDAVIAAGGVPVLAHPGDSCYDPDYKRTVKLMLERGVMGIECYHPANTKEITEYCLKVCRQNSLYITGGSDYHRERVTKRRMGVPKVILSDVNLKDLIKGLV